MDQIKAGLERDGIKNGAGRKKWGTTNIRKILTNEKYMGDAMLQKTITVDVLNKTRIPNDGREVQYYIEDHHEPIVSRAVYQMYVAAVIAALRCTGFIGTLVTRK